MCQITLAQSIFTSTGGGGNYTNAASWSEDNQGNADDADGIPDSNDHVVITSGNPITIATSTDQNCDDLTLIDGSLTFTISGSDLNVTGNLLVNGTGTSNLASDMDYASDPRIDLTGTLTVNTSNILVIDQIRFQANSATTINGTLTFNSTPGAKVFSDITVNASGEWNNGVVAESFNIDGSIVNDGTWNGCANTTGCRYTFRTDGSTISGSDTVYITDVRVNNGVTLTNNGLLVVTDNIDGASAPITGVFVNGSTGVLNLRDNGAYSELTFTLNTVGSTVIYDGTGNEAITLGPFYNLEVNKPNITTLVDVSGANVTVDNNLTLIRGRMRLQTANTLAVTGNVTITDNSEFEPNNSEAVANIGGNLSMTGGLFDHNDGDLNITGDIIITGGTMTMNEATTPVNPSTIDATDMSVATGSVTLSEGTLTLSNASGGLTVSSGSFTKNNAANTLTIAGDYDISGGTNDINSGVISFVNMDISGGGSINVASPTITSTGTITVDNGTFTSDGNGGTYAYNNISVNANGTWNVTSAYDPTINGNISNSGTFTGCSTATGCVYTLTSTSGTISGSGVMNTMSDFVLNDGASYTNTNSGGLNITDRLATTSGTGTFVNGANGVLSYGGTTGNFSVTNFTASASPNTVTYNRTTSNQLIEPTTDGFYHNLIIDKADGIDATTNTVFTINNNLTLTLGDLIMGNQNLIIADGATISGGNASSYIQDTGNGVVRRNLSATGSFFVPIGGTSYSPITLTLNAATIGGSASIDFSITDTSHPNRDRDNTGDASPGDDDGTAATDFLDVFWTVSGNNITSPVFNASYTYDASDFTQTTEANMVGALYRTLPTGTIDWLARGTVNATNNVVSFTNADAFGDLYAMDNTLNRLPIVLISFEAKVTESTIVLEWVTASEENNDFYTVERSLDGRSFFPVLTKEGAGDSDQSLSYKAVDHNPMKGRSFYRLKQTDFNGQFEYSEIRSVFFEGGEAKFEIQVYPNPISRGEWLLIELSPNWNIEFLQIRVVQSSGRNIDQNFERIGNTVRIPTSDLKSGLYVIQVTDGSRQVTKKVIVR